MKKYQNLLSENFLFLEVKFSIYLNRRVFVMEQYYTCRENMNAGKKTAFLALLIIRIFAGRTFPTVRFLTFRLRCVLHLYENHKIVRMIIIYVLCDYIPCIMVQE